jgi:hypothetical protein
MAVKGPGRRRFTGQLQKPGAKPENIDLFLEEQYIVTGWDDITADLSAGKPGATSPTWAVYRDGIYAWRFGAATDDELFITFHIKHDYAETSKVYPHVHWSPNTTSTGTVRWGMEYTIAKGHDQEAFPATTTIYMEETISEDKQYQHFITEASDAQAFNAFEADTLILVRIFREGSADTFPDPVFGLTADIHFQTDRQSTPNRSPPFTAR